uniref:Uncharacterized protein n=1 Tax=Anguilla anguilla TaxID=7936 RepID=A0A0E9Q5E9_ANGAN
MPTFLLCVCVFVFCVGEGVLMADFSFSKHKNTPFNSMP